MTMATIGGTPPPGYIDVSLDQLDELEKAGKELKFETPEQREEYLKLVAQAREERSSGISNPTLQIPRPLNAAELGLTGERIDSSIANLGPNITDLMSLLHELGNEMKKAGKFARQAGREAEQNTLQAAADKIRSAAAFSFAAGVVGGATQIAGGMMSLAGSIRSGATAMGANSGTGGAGGAGQQPPKLEIGGHRAPPPSTWVDGTKPGAQPPGQAGAPGQSGFKGQLAAMKGKLDSAINYKNYDTAGMSQTERSNLAQIQSQRWSATSQLMQGGSQMLTSGLEYGAKMEEGKKAELDAEAKKMSYLVQDEDEVIRNMQELMATARQKLAEIEQANNQAMSRIWS
jgi:hypothetical protein